MHTKPRKTDLTAPNLISLPGDVRLVAGFEVEVEAVEVDGAEEEVLTVTVELSGGLVGFSGTAGIALSQGGLEVTGGLGGLKGGTKL